MGVLGTWGAAAAYTGFNALTDGLLLWLTARLAEERPAGWRLGVAAAMGALLALVPWPGPGPLLARWLGAPLVVAVGLGVPALGPYLARLGTFLTLGAAAGAAALGLMWLAAGWLPELPGAAPAAGLAAVAGLVALGRGLQVPFVRPRQAVRAERRVRLLLILGSSRLPVTGLVDTGNRLVDPLAGEPVLVVDRALLDRVLPAGLRGLAEVAAAAQAVDRLGDEWRRRWRLVPYRSVGGSGALWGMRLDGAIWLPEGIPLPPAVVAQSTASLGLPHGAHALVPAVWLAAAGRTWRDLGA